MPSTSLGFGAAAERRGPAARLVEDMELLRAMLTSARGCPDAMSDGIRADGSIDGCCACIPARMTGLVLALRVASVPPTWKSRRSGGGVGACFEGVAAPRRGK